MKSINHQNQVCRRGGARFVRAVVLAPGLLLVAARAFAGPAEERREERERHEIRQERRELHREERREDKREERAPVVVAPGVRGGPVRPTFAPPPPVVERVRPRPGFVWAPGYHEWRDGRYVWVGGRYEAERPGYIWVGPRWELQNGVFVAIPGAWVNVEAQPAGPPPPAIVEPPPAPRAGFVWIPGYHEWRGGAYVWVGGRWEAERPHERWHPGHWELVGNHWAWHPGSWHRH